MTDRLVDVLNKRGHVLHTYVISLTGQPGDQVYEAKGLEAAVFSQLVDADEMPTLSARLHVDRPGQMASYGDDLPKDLQTRGSWEHGVRVSAYFLWEAAGCPEGNSDYFWMLALDEQRRALAYSLWELEKRPEGQAAEHWNRVRTFEQ